MHLSDPNHPHARKRRTARILSGVVIATGVGLVLASTVGDWYQVMNQTKDATTDPALIRQYHSVDTPATEEEPSDHVAFTLDELMSPGGKAREDNGEAEPFVAVNLDGEWASTASESSAVSDLDWNSCAYSIGDFTLSLKESDGRIFGVGIHSMSSTSCASTEDEITSYDAVTGTLTSEYVKLTILDGQSGKAKFAYLGTVRPEGILGQIRSTDGELLLEHVALTRQ